MWACFEASESLRTATLGVASYRFAQFFFPIILGGLMYASLRVGPWRIERRERLIRLRDLAEEETKRGISRVDFQLRSTAMAQGSTFGRRTRHRFSTRDGGRFCVAITSPMMGRPERCQVMTNYCRLAMMKNREQ